MSCLALNKLTYCSCESCFCSSKVNSDFSSLHLCLGQFFKCPPNETPTDVIRPNITAEMCLQFGLFLQA